MGNDAPTRIIRAAFLTMFLSGAGTLLYGAGGSTHVLGARQQALSNADDIVNAGVYSTTTLHAVDADLAVANIKQGTTVFGFTGTYTSDANATAGDILLSKTAYVNGSKLTGTIVSQTLSAANDTVNSGVYSATTLHAVDADLAAGNIVAGANIFGFAGTYTGDANASAGDLLLSKVAYANGSKLTGIITSQTLSAANDTVAPGIYAGTTLHAVDADLAVENIKPGATLFGFSGTCTADGTATAGDIVASKTAYVNNVKLTGTKATVALDPANDTVNAGTYLAATLHAVDADLAVGNIAAGKNIFGFAGTYTSDANAAAADILNPQTAYVNGVKLTGTLSLAAQSLSAANDTVNGGTYSATTLHAVDADLAAVNIKSGVNIFGFVGVIALPDTGQTTSYAAGDDAAYNPATTQKYFVDNGNGTITDNRTGLMWKKCSEPDAATNCFGAHNTYTWANAITQCEGLSYASQGDWRLPNAMELFSIVTQEGSAPLIDAVYFPSTVSDTYWTSTSYTVNTSTPLSVGFDHGDLYNGRAKTETGYVRCVRGGP